MFTGYLFERQYQPVYEHRIPYVKGIPLQSIQKSESSKPITARRCFSIPPVKIKKRKGFLMFSGGIEKHHQAVMA